MIFVADFERLVLLLLTESPHQEFIEDAVVLVVVAATLLLLLLSLLYVFSHLLEHLEGECGVSRDDQPVVLRQEHAAMSLRVLKAKGKQRYIKNVTLCLTHLLGFQQ